MKALFAYACAGTLLLVAGTASATDNNNCTERRALKFFSQDTAGILWQSGRQDSPLDANGSRVMVTVLHQDGVFPYDYAGAFGECTGIIGKTINQVRNLSFDFMNASRPVSHPVHIGAGAPRYSVDLDTDGDNIYDGSAYLAASYCEAVHPEDPAWSRADFTGRVIAGCSLQFGADTYTSDGASSAWALFAAAHPTYKVLDAYLVMDEDGTAFVDRLAFHNRMFQSSGSGTAAVKACASEAVC
jgi:hypothetical protein